MAEEKLPAWDNDSLSSFLSDAEYNERGISLRYPEIYALLQHVHDTFRQFSGTPADREELMLARFLMVRTHSAFLASVRLAMSGQVSESIPVLRVAIEQAWYALHIAKDPDPPIRAKTWLSRNDDASSKSMCKSEFTIARVRSTHEALDTATAKQLQKLYEKLIDFGAHPNQSGILSSVSKSQSDTQTNYEVAISSLSQPFLLFALRMAVGVSVGVLKVFELIFSKRFAALGIEMENLIQQLNAVFKPYQLPIDALHTTG